MVLKADVGMKFDRVRVERILALSLELSDIDLAQLIQRLGILQNERNQKVLPDNIDTISV